MKKLLLILSFFAVSSFSFAGTEKYKVNDAAVEQMFAQSKDISSSVADEMTLAAINQPSCLHASGDQSVVGFLIRAFFCGFIGLHRSYMGSDFGSMWWKYCCSTVVVGWGIIQGVDFCWVLLDGSDALGKYKGNDRFLVWL